MADTADIDDIVDVVGEDPPEGDAEGDASDSGDEPQSPEGDEADEPSDDEDDTADDEGEGEPAPEPAPEQSGYAKLLAKYDGDPEKLAGAVHEQDSTIAALHAEVKAIKDALKTRSPEEEEAAIASDPDVQELATEVTTLKSDLDEMEKTQKGYVAEFGRVGVLIAKLEGKLEVADDEAKPEIRRQLEAAQAEQKQIFRDNNRIIREYSKADKDLRKAAREYKAAIASVKTKRAEAANLALAEATFIREQRNEFNAHVRQAAQRYGVDPASQRFQMLHESVKSRLSGLIRSLPDDAPAIDLPEAVDTLMDEFAVAMGLKKGFQQKSKLKHIVAGAPTPKPDSGAPKPPKKPAKGQPWTADYVRARAKRLLG